MEIDKFLGCNKYRACLTCSRNNLGNKPIPPEGYFYTESESLVLKECEAHKKWKERTSRKYKYIQAGVDTEYTFDDYNGRDKENLNYLIKFTENFGKFKDKTMVYLHGPNGTMKTCMAKYAGKVLIDNGFSVQYILMQDLINTLVSIKDSEDTMEEKEALIKRLYEVDLLIIDESFDKNKVILYKSGFQLPYLDSFLRNRFEIKRKSILLISNVSPNLIAEEGFGNSIQDFVVRNTIQSRILFKYRFYDNAGNFDPAGLFK